MKTIIFTLSVLTSLFLITSCNSTKTNYDLLQGRWVSTDDAKSEIKFEGDKRFDIYDGESLGGDVFILSNECTEDSNAKSNPEGQFIVAFSDESIFCYQIVILDDKNLELQFQGRGNTLTYTKK